MDRPSKKLRLDKNSSLLQAIRMNNHNEVVFSIENSADINPQVKEWTETPLGIAIHYGNAQIIETLILNGAKPNIKFSHDETPIHLAIKARENQEEIINILVNHGADIEAKETIFGSTPLHMAVRRNEKELVKLLLNHGADINSTNRSKETPIHVAVKKQNKEIVEILLLFGADINKENSINWTPLHVAVRNKNEDIMKLLIQNGARINPSLESRHFKAPLHQAVEDNEKSIVELLLKSGANIEVRDRLLGRSPLHYAADKNHTSILKVLLENGADTEAEDRYHYTPIILPIRNDHNEAVEILLEHGAKLDHLISDQITPIHMAILFNRKHILQTLLNTNPNLSHRSFASILQLATLYGDLEISRILIQYGVDIDSHNPAAGGPPIHLTISLNKDNPIEMTEWLLTNGASSKIRDEDGITPLECAMKEDIDHKLDLIKVITFFEHSHGTSHKKVRIEEI